LIIAYLMPQGLASLPQTIKSAFTEPRKEKMATHAS
jgi:hypothetical protein